MEKKFLHYSRYFRLKGLCLVAKLAVEFPQVLASTYYLWSEQSHSHVMKVE